MNRSDLIDIVSNAILSRREGRVAVDSALEAIAAALERGETVNLTGFGTFRTVERKARTGRHPRTGATLKIDARTTATFVPGKRLRNIARR